jgi:hypothetical protein
MDTTTRLDESDEFDLDIRVVPPLTAMQEFPIKAGQSGTCAGQATCPDTCTTCAGQATCNLTCPDTCTPTCATDWCDTCGFECGNP